jgi:hypothetical protein
VAGAWPRHRFFEGLARALLAVGRPMMLVLDNMQWCDQETLDFVAFCLGLAPGTRVALQSYEPGKQWFTYGQGLVSADGTQIVPEAGVEFHRVTCYLTLGNLVSFLAAILGGLRAGDPVDIATGIFTMEKTDLVLPDVIPIVIKREYRQNDTVARNGEFGVSQSFFYQMMLLGDNTTYAFAELMLGNGTRVHYQRTSPGTDRESAVMAHTGTAQNPATPTGFAGRFGNAYSSLSAQPA